MSRSTDRVATEPDGPRPRRWPLRLALGLLTAAIVGPLLALNAAVRREDGTRWLLSHVPGLTVVGLQGALAGDSLRIDELRWSGTPQQPSLHIEQLQWSRPSWQWLPTGGAWIGLALERLQAARVSWQSPVRSEPGEPPTQLRLPFLLAVDTLQVGEVRVDIGTPLRELTARVVLGGRDGSEHRVEAVSVQIERARLQGRAQIGADAPMPVSLAAEAHALEGTPWQASLQASGPLARLETTARLRGEANGNAAAPMLDAQARIEPFAAWPLAALTLSTDELDLAALSADAPRTRIRARAKVDTAGLDKAASASVQLDNLAPGRWDARRLPLRQLQLDLGATPNRLDRIDIRHLDALLADERGTAGRVEGRGSWEGSNLRLQLQTRGVQPARLDARAGSLEVGGPLTLDVQGLPAPSAQPRTSSTPPAPAAAWRAQLQADLTGTLGSARAPVRAQLQAELSAERVALTKLQARSGDASLSARLQAQRLAGGAAGGGWQLDGEGELSRFDPLPWWPGTAGSAWSRGPHRFDGRWQIQSLVLPESFGEQLSRDRMAALAALRGELQVELGDSLLAGVPLTGRAQLRGQASALAVDMQAQAANNRIELNGQWAHDAGDDRWQLHLGAPALASLQPLFALLPPDWAAPAQALRGDIRADAQLRGRWPAIGSQGQLQARAVQWRGARLAQADASWSIEPGEAGALKLQATLTDAQQGVQRIETSSARIEGTRSSHRVQLQIDTPLRPPAWSEALIGPTNGGTRLSFDAQGQWQREAGGGSTWRADPAALRIGGKQDAGAAWLDARALQLQVSLDERGLPRRAQLAPGRALLPAGAALRWTEAAWQAGAGDDRIDLRGEIEPLAVAPLLARLQPDIGWAGDLTLAGRVEVHAAERFDADLVLERAGGDLRIADETGAPQSLGLSDLRLAFAAHDGLWQFAQGAAGRQLGEMAGSQVVRTHARTRWPAADAPLEGVLEMRVANLGAWGVWVPPGWRLGGSLQVSGALGGRFGAPELRGNLRGSDLSVRNTLQGIGVSDGELSATLDGAVARVQRFEFKGGDGTLRLTGEATLGDAPSAHLRLQAQRFRLLGRIDRRLVASGQAALDFSRDLLKLDGRFVVDEGLIDLSRGDTPSLASDVTVVRPANGAASAAATSAERAARPVPAVLRDAQIALAIDLGEKLQVRGRGLDAGLRGDLKLSTPGGRLAVNGTVRTASGTYLAYAQKMTIERGDLQFAGEADNPRLDIIAIRPNLDVRVGVAVTGTLASPRVRLFSEPEMSEMDKLSWLVLGRASDGLGRTDTALLQRAAVALLSGEKQGPTDQVLNQIGLSDFSLRQSEGETRETIVSLGRQLSQRWYVGYERSVNATTGTWQLIYRVAQRFTLRAQSGVENSLDVIWSWRWN